MKNIFSLLMACILVTAVSAQTESSEKINYGNRITKGTVLLNGGFYFVNASNDFNESTEFSINFGGNFALNKRFAVGLGIGYARNKYVVGKDTPSEIESEYDSFTISPAFSVFGDVNFGWLQPFGTLSIPIGFGGDETSYTSYGGAIGGGLNIYVSRKLALTASMGVIRYTQTSYEDSDDNNNQFSVGFNPGSLNFGLLFLLGSE